MARADDFQVRVIRLSSGERLPLLLGPDRVPLFIPTTWLLTTRRRADVAMTTLFADCFHLKLLYRWAIEHHINLERRMLDGQYLTPAEQVSLTDACSTQLSETHQGPRKKTAENILRFGTHVSRIHKKTRIRQITSFLDWLGEEGIQRVTNELTKVLRRDELGKMVSALKKAGKAKRSRISLDLRQAPEREQIFRLLEVINVDSPDNPWATPPQLFEKIREAQTRGKHWVAQQIDHRIASNLGLRLRNELLVWMILSCALRRGEVMGLRVNDIDALQNRVFILRKADDPNDPRMNEPLTKGNDGSSILKDGLIRMLYFYINFVRAKIPGAKKHDYLFVSHQTGRALGKEACNKVFTVLREKVPDLPENLTPHLLRHASNDEYSRLCDLMKVDPESERRNRERLNRWCLNSSMKRVYDRRHEQEISDQFALKQQDRIWKRVKGEPENA